MKEKKFFIHPITILFLMIVSSFLFFVPFKGAYIAALSLSLGIEFLMARKSFFKSVSVLLILIFFIHVIFVNIGFFLIFFIPLLKLMPVLILAQVMAEFTSSELLWACRKIHLPETLAISVAVFFRFLPEFKHRLKEVREGAKVRGYGFHPLHPLRSFEIFVVPLLYKGLLVSDTISCAIWTKGIESTCEKTELHPANFSYRDVAVSMLMFCIVGGGLWKIF